LESGRVKTKYASYDVVVIGGGLSGMCAAIAASRHGAKTALVHARHVFGGNASSEIRMHICGASESSKKPELEEAGILLEMMLENKSRNDYYNFSVWDMVLYSTVKREENLTAYLNTAMEDCETENGRIKCVVCYQQTTETRWIIDGSIFIDCTGNGTLGYLAGAEYRTGSESRAQTGEPDAPEVPDNNRMGNTLLFKAVDRGHSVNFRRPDFARTFTEDELKYRTHSAVHKANTKEGVDPKYLHYTAGSTRGIDYGYWWIELCGKSDDIIDEYEIIRDDLVSAVYGVWDHLKNVSDHGAENYDLEWVGMLPGMRESRRLMGDYILNENDILSHRQFEDAVAYGGWAMDIHTPGGLLDYDELPSKIISFDGCYTIPYRSYCSKNIHNLMMAGRNISTTKMAMGSTRVMGTCAIGGQAVGTAAAMCIKYGCDPRAIGGRIEELQQTLLRDDCYIPGISSTDKNDRAQKADVSASSSKRGHGAENLTNGITRTANGRENLWISDGISESGETVTLNLNKRAETTEVRLVFDSNFSYAIKPTMSQKRQSQQRVGVPQELVKDYKITLYDGSLKTAEKYVKDNFQRLNTVKFDGVICDRVEITVTSTNGAPDARIYEVRVY